jgi:cytochrome c oxidase subunit 2
VIWIAIYSYQTYDQMSVLGPMEHVHMMASAQAAPLENEETTENIEVFSRQWSWEFRYGDVTSTELHLPNNQRIKLALHSEDVLHGFYIPAFRLKQDIIPGQVIDFEFTPIREGKYRLRDSQYSGTYFAAMQTDVVVESPDSYKKWLKDSESQKPTKAYNRAFTEYSQRNNRDRWKIVEPAAPPVVNYSDSQTK